MKNMDKIRRARRWAFAAVAALVLGLALTSQNVASEKQDAFFDRTGQCLIWFLTDMPRHDLECIGDFNSGDAETGIGGVGTGEGCPEFDEELHSSIDAERSYSFVAAGVYPPKPVDPCFEPAPAGYIGTFVLDLFAPILNI